MRVLWGVTILGNARNANSDSQVLLAHKAAMYLSRTRGWHVYLVAGCDLGFLPEHPRLTTVSVPPLCGRDGEGRISLDFGLSPGLAGVVKVIRDVGPDVLVAWNPRLALMLAMLREANGNLTRSLLNKMPILFWDASPSGLDIVERRGTGGSGPVLAAAMLCPDAMWHFSEATLSNAFHETRRHFGFAPAQRLLDRSELMPCVVDKEYMESVCPPDEPVARRDEFTVHIGGRWSGTKGYGRVAEAVMQLRGMGEPIRLLTTGRRSGSIAFRKAVAEADMELATGLTQEQMWRVARTCHVGVLAQDSQCLPLLPLEQIAVGLPVLVRSTKHLTETLPQYPLVWTSHEELMAQMIDVMHHHEQACQAVQGWWLEHWQDYDISQIGVGFDRLVEDVRSTETYGIVLDGLGVPNITPAGQGGWRLRASLFQRTAARQRAKSLGYVEDLDNPVPTFTRPEEEDDSSQ